MYFLSVWYYQQILVNYHYSFQIVSFLKRDFYKVSLNILKT